MGLGSIPARLFAVVLIALIGPAESGAARSGAGGDFVSPTRQIDHRSGRDRRTSTSASSPTFSRSRWRAIDGVGNDPGDPQANATGTPLLRVMPSDYADGVSALAGADRPSARFVSNLVCDQAAPIPNPIGTSDYLWQWGQFLDHDIDLTDGTDPPELEPIPVPTGDVFFDPDGTGGVTIPFNRSLYDATAPTGVPRQQLNEITGWIDGSNVYGSDVERAEALRTLDGSGRLRMGESGLLPDDDTDLPNATGGSFQVMFLAGDVRANEQVGLTAMHTLFVREHNRVAEEIRRRDPGATGDLVYERARRYVGALIQAITYREYLPALLGPDVLSRYDGYDPSVDARIANSFSAAAYRYGHSSLPPALLRLDQDLEEIPAGSLALRDAFFSPDRIRQEGGIAPILRGLASQRHQKIDTLIIDDVRNFLFGRPGDGGFDLASLNLQRGRDHGLPSYAASRALYGLPPVSDFADVTSDPEIQARLGQAYASVFDVDLWIGGLAEDPVAKGHLGPLFTRMVAEQFEALRDGDRFWYESALPSGLVREIEATRLADVIRRNTSIGDEIPDDVFYVDDGRSGARHKSSKRHRRHRRR